MTLDELTAAVADTVAQLRLRGKEDVDTIRIAERNGTGRGRRFLSVAYWRTGAPCVMEIAPRSKRDR